MSGKATAVAATVLAVGGFTVAGCGSSGGDSAPATGSSTASAAAEVPAGYDPCNDVPQGVLDALQLHMKIPAKDTADDGTAWRGCQWVKSNAYGVAITITGATLDTVKGKYPDAQQFTIAGRPALSSRQLADHTPRQCTVNVQIKGGSLDIFLSDNDGPEDSCGLARNIAEQVTPTLPPSL
ncbi:MAG: DUF3558 domain-containing protein [Nocardia sp.]|nr:DUF3558 domain-containing protein [Nocardia sp.]